MTEANINYLLSEDINEEGHCSLLKPTIDTDHNEWFYSLSSRSSSSSAPSSVFVFRTGLLHLGQVGKRVAA